MCSLNGRVKILYGGLLWVSQEMELFFAFSCFPNDSEVKITWIGSCADE